MTLPQFEIAQLLLLRSGSGPDIVARSEGIEFVHEEFASRTAVAYGVPPDSESEFEAVFTLPYDAETVAIATVKASRDAGPRLAMRFLFVPVPLYRWIGDPFAISDRQPMSALARGRLPVISWQAEPRPQRSVEALQQILQTGDAPFLLGATQALLDGTRIRILSPDSKTAPLRQLWQLLPDVTRCEVWPCEYVCDDGLPFHIAAVPSLPARLPPGFITDEQARDYPAARYELALQAAIESGDQSALDELLARRSPREVLRMTLVMLFVAIVAAVAINFFKD